MTPSSIPFGRWLPRPRSGGRRVFDLPLEHGPLAPAAARHAARPLLAAWGLDEDQVYDALLVISELVTNSVTHALPPVVLHLHAATAHGTVHVHVSDGGPQFEPHNWAADRPAGEHGRGTAIVSALVESGGITDTDETGLIDHWASLAAV